MSTPTQPSDNVKQSLPENQLIHQPFSNALSSLSDLFPSPSDSSPPHSTQSFSAAISNLSHLFLVLIGQCSMSNCLPERINPHFRDKLVPTVFLRLINHLIDTDRIVPIFEPSDLDEVIGETINNCNKELDNGLGLHDALLWIVAMVYVLVNIIENAGLVSHTVRLTDPEFDYHSPLFTRFTQLLEPELNEFRRQFDPDLYEEAKLITLWRELLKKIADGEEVENDKSFLKLPFFRPTLLSLQAKFQHLASFSDHSEDSSMSSLHSSHFSPHTSLEAHIGSSLRTRSSGTLFKQESLQLLTLFHSLVTSPLPPSLPKQSPDDSFQAILAFYPLNDLDPTERFDSSLFDEEDDEILTKSLIRCFFVCELVGAEHCITDLPSFFDRTVSTLGSSNHQVRFVASSIHHRLVQMPRVFSQLPHVWNRLRSAFRDGWPEEQYALIQISAIWIDVISDGEALPPFPFF
ncbi:hypothetical protein BLNAU_23894 [Blattamonas nauphoetae]|uniref:Uncharacterized protein n=1 Tax=Blattamonas nauphoetae TaxID=2049346 RepID=A0ABQ9WNX5_9EUKA|nr:hypothetical protein BLNAU_23894 [Blattamonas nauphoetae]